MAVWRASRILTATLFCLAASPGTTGAASSENDRSYPTEARSEYVFACMAANGNNQQALHRCSCAIDVIASLLPYDRYERAETVLRMRRSGGGYLGQEFRTAISSDMVRELEEAQAEAEVRCF
ncbi:MAG: hypothetical protein JO110_19590 [Acetobacteraceae bacterium]|nr:hypothetical protein [Acetobacteraceae bacterium]